MSLADRFGYRPPERDIFEEQRRGNPLVKSGIRVFKPEPDKISKVRILPDLSGQDMPIATFWLHAKPKPLARDGSIRDVWCSESLGTGSCEICNYIRKVRDSQPADVIKEFFPRRPRTVARVIVRGKEDDGVMLWFVPKTVIDSISVFAEEWQQKFNLPVKYDITHPDEGVDIRFRRVGSGITTNYVGVSFASDEPTPVHEDEEKAVEWLEKCRDPLVSWLEPSSEEDVNNYLSMTKGLLLDGERAETEAAKELEGEDEIPF